MHAKSKVCVIKWFNMSPRQGKMEVTFSFDVTDPLQCEQAERQLDLLHDAWHNYKIEGALFQGHGFPIAAQALMEPDLAHGANVH